MFLVCGEALYDVFYAPPDREGMVSMQAVIGGSPLNVATGLSRQGMEAGFFAGISTDPLGEGLAEHVAREKISPAYLRRKRNPTTLSLIGLTAAGVPNYSFYGHAAADISLTLDDLPVLGPEVTGIHAGSYTLVQQPGADALAALIAREAHRLITLDPNIRPTVQPDMAVWRARVDALMPHVSVVKASEEDIELMYPREDIETVSRRWLAAGPAMAVVTRGMDGAIAFTHTGAVITSAPNIRVVDTVGAGDTFQATLIAGLVQAGAHNRAGVAALAPQSLEVLIRRSVCAASITCQRRGADLPTAREIDAAMPRG